MINRTLLCLAQMSVVQKPLLRNKKIRELKKSISKIKTISDQSKAKISPTTIIKSSAENMNNV